MTNIKIPQTTAADPFKYVLLDPKDTNQFKSLFNSDNTKLPLSIYGDGKHGDEKRVDAKIKLWGGRIDNKEDVMKCFLVFSNEGDKILGFVNIGLNSYGTYEFGTLFSDNVSKEQQAKALKDILVNYLQVNKENLTKMELIGTQTTVKHLDEIMEKILVDRLQTNKDNQVLAQKVLEIQDNKGQALEKAGLTKLSLPPKPGFEENLLNKLIADGKRFFVDVQNSATTLNEIDTKTPEGQVISRPVDLFYFNFAATKLALLVGEVVAGLIGEHITFEDL